MNFLTCDMFYGSDHAPARWKDYYRLARWGLTTALLHSAYFMTGDLRDHHWNNYYDEFDVPLGYPTGPAQSL